MALTDPLICPVYRNHPKDRHTPVIRNKQQSLQQSKRAFCALPAPSILKANLPSYSKIEIFYWLNKHSCPKSLARSIWNWIKKGWALFIQRWVLTQRESSAPDCREDGLGKDLYYLPTGIRTLSLWRGLPCDLGQKRLQSLFPQQDLYQILSKL